jgi:hypothetical protein
VRWSCLKRQFFSELCLLDATLLPWGIDESIATKNPQVLDKNHFMQKNCFGAIWMPTYAKESNRIAQSKRFNLVTCCLHLV